MTLIEAMKQGDYYIRVQGIDRIMVFDNGNFEVRGKSPNRQAYTIEIYKGESEEEAVKHLLTK